MTWLHRQGIRIVYPHTTTQSITEWLSPPFFRQPWVVMGLLLHTWSSFSHLLLGVGDAVHTMGISLYHHTNQLRNFDYIMGFVPTQYKGTIYCTVQMRFDETWKWLICRSQWCWYQLLLYTFWGFKVKSMLNLKTSFWSTFCVLDWNPYIEMRTPL